MYLVTLHGSHRGSDGTNETTHGLKCSQAHVVVTLLNVELAAEKQTASAT